MAYPSIFFNREQVLSRLCGGEAVFVTPTNIVSFLSRLCGGEEDGEGKWLAVPFLSRLCGGEVKSGAN